MKTKKTQQQQVVEQLAKQGFVTNLWAIKNYILRLGAIIYELRKEGTDITSVYGEKVVGASPSDRKNCFYILTKRVKRNKDGTVSITK